MVSGVRPGMRTELRLREDTPRSAQGSGGGGTCMPASQQREV